MQEILPEEHVVSAGFRFPEDKDNRNIFAKTADGETIMIGLLVADKRNLAEWFKLSSKYVER